MRNAHRLEGRVALVTGGSRGIGRAVAELFAREGATVVVNHWRDAEAAAAVVAALHAISAAEGHPAQAHGAVEADVADAAAVERMVADVAGRCGALHILVNNAGMQVETPGDSFDDAAFLRVIGVDLVGPALCSRAALKLFLAQAAAGGPCPAASSTPPACTRRSPSPAMPPIRWPRAASATSPARWRWNSPGAASASMPSAPARSRPT